MSTYDMQSLVKNIDPRFRQQETMEYNRIVQQAEVFHEAGVSGDAMREDRMDQAARMIAASIYVIARDLKLPPGDIGLVAGHATGFFVGASSPADPQSLQQFRIVFGKALEQANTDKPRSMVMMADMVESGMQIMRRYRNGA